MYTMVAFLCITIGSVMFAILYMISLQPKGLSMRIGDSAYRICGIVRMISMVFEILVIVGYIIFALGSEGNRPIVTHGVLGMRIAGVVVTVAVLTFMFIGVFAAGKEAALPDKDTELYQGIYQTMRHPQTLGEILSWFGIAMMLNSLTLLLYSLLFVPMFISFTIIEDNDLVLRFGDSYLAYMKRVGIFWRRRDQNRST